MSCNNCITACNIHPCYDKIWFGKASANAIYQVEITNIGTGRKVSEQIQATNQGYLKLASGTWSDFFNSNSQFQIKIYVVDYSVSPHVSTNDVADFYVITGFTGAYYNITPTVSTSQYDCILFETEMLYDGDGEALVIDNQYLINEDA